MSTPPDLSEFYKLSRPKKPPCRIGFALGQLPPKDSASLKAACAADPGIITNSAIRQWLAGREHDASVSAIVSHRKGTCTCE